mgnify:CR=1 FL=1
MTANGLRTWSLNTYVCVLPSTSKNAGILPRRAQDFDLVISRVFDFIRSHVRCWNECTYAWVRLRNTIRNSNFRFHEKRRTEHRRYRISLSLSLSLSYQIPGIPYLDSRLPPPRWGRKRERYARAMQIAPFPFLFSFFFFSLRLLVLSSHPWPSCTPLVSLFAHSHSFSLSLPILARFDSSRRNNSPNVGDADTSIVFTWIVNVVWCRNIKRIWEVRWNPNEVWDRESHRTYSRRLSDAIQLPSFVFSASIEQSMIFWRNWRKNASCKNHVSRTSTWKYRNF